MILGMSDECFRQYVKEYLEKHPCPVVEDNYKIKLKKKRGIVMNIFDERVKKNEKKYSFHKGDKVSFIYKNKKHYGTITGYVFYGADKFCVSPAYIIEYRTKLLHKIKTIVIYNENCLTREELK